MIDAIDQIIIDIKSGSINEAKEKILKLEQDAYKRGFLFLYISKLLNNEELPKEAKNQS